MSTALTQPTYQRLAAQDRSKPMQVSGKLKTVLDRVVNEGADPYEAGRIVGMHARSIRLALAKPHVLAYLRHARHVLRETARAQNIHHAVVMRANSSNEMAKLGAMKLLEGLDDERASGRGMLPMAPGLVIQIISPPAPRESSPVIDVEPAPKLEIDREAKPEAPVSLPSRRSAR